MKLPSFLLVRQHFETPVLAQVEAEIRARFDSAGLEGRARKGATVAVGCSSRGIGDYAAIVSTAVSCLKETGLRPFLFPAMGSHGSATAEGQKEVLARAGITESSVGAPIRSGLETVKIGKTPEGVPVRVDKAAWEADHLAVINRIKSHTEFNHDFQSGLLKMLAIGVGKKDGAALYHKAFMVHGYHRIILSVASKLLGTGKVLFGLGVVENGLGETACVDLLTSERLVEGEKELFMIARRLEPSLPFQEVDILIVDEMGKEISGSGIDTKVVGRILMPLIADEPPTPSVKRILVCDLTEQTGGNADGVGLADFVSRRLVEKIDFDALYVNALAGGEPEHAKVPLTLKNDREAVDAAVESVGLIPPEALKILRIRNTARLDVLEVSEAYAETVRDRSNLEILGPPRPLRFDSAGNLFPLSG